MSKPAAAPDLDADETAFCLRTLAKAKKAGVQVEHLATRLGHSFEWLLPSGQIVRGSIQRTKELALFDACLRLLPHIFKHI